MKVEANPSLSLELISPSEPEPCLICGKPTPFMLSLDGEEVWLCNAHIREIIDMDADAWASFYRSLEDYASSFFQCPSTMPGFIVSETNIVSYLALYYMADSPEQLSALIQKTVALGAIDPFDCPFYAAALFLKIGVAVGALQEPMDTILRLLNSSVSAKTVVKRIAETIEEIDV